MKRRPRRRRRVARAPSPARIAIALADQTWRRDVAAPVRLVRRAANAAIEGAEADVADSELSIVLADDLLLRRLNREYRGKDKPTNVLSFPTGTNGLKVPLLGDVVIAHGTTAGEAEAQGKSVADHLSHLVVHGVLHLLGYDHEKASDARRMERLETGILAGLGIGDPYRLKPRAKRG
jgi:probable rRNA maturation factor